MKKRGIIKAVTAVLAAAILTSGMAITAWADTKLEAVLDFKTPDGSDVQTQMIGGRTVHLLPYNSTISLAKTNGAILGVGYGADLKNYEEANGSIKHIGTELMDLNKGVTYTLNTNDLLEWTFSLTYRPYKGNEWNKGWVLERNEGAIDFKNMPEYDYFTISIHDQDSYASGISGRIEYYFRFANDAITNAITSSWASDSKGWWIQNSDGSCLKNAWYQAPNSGLWYFMGPDGYMLTNTTTPDGCVVNADGVWVQ